MRKIERIAWFALILLVVTAALAYVSMQMLEWYLPDDRDPACTAAGEIHVVAREVLSGAAQYRVKKHEWCPGWHALRTSLVLMTINYTLASYTAEHVQYESRGYLLVAARTLWMIVTVAALPLYAPLLWKLIVVKRCSPDAVEKNEKKDKREQETV